MNAAQDADDLIQRAYAERPAIECALPAGSTAFQTAEAAAVAALESAMVLPHARRVEAAGVVYRCGRVFSHTEPRQAASSWGFSMTFSLPAGAKLAAIFHTHPGNVGDLNPNRFSADDVALQRQLGVPSYIGVVASKTVRVLTADMNAGKTAAGKPVTP